MSVVLSKCGERVDRREGEERKDGFATAKSATRVWYVETDSKYDDQAVVLSAACLPQMFDFYRTPTTSDVSMVVVGRSPKQIGPTSWDVEIRYETPKPEDGKTDSGGGGGGDPNSTDPEDWGTKVALGFESYQEVIAGDGGEDGYTAGGAALTRGFTNSAGEPFDPPAVIDKSRPIITFTSWVKNPPYKDALKYIDTVNNDNFLGAQSRQLRITEFSTPGKERKLAGGVEVDAYQRTIRMAYKRETWDVQVLDQGTFWLDGSNKRAFLTSEGQPYIGLLNGSGGRLADDADHVFITRRCYAMEAFAALGLPNL